MSLPKPHGVRALRVSGWPVGAAILLALGCRAYAPFPLDPAREWSALLGRAESPALDAHPRLGIRAGVQANSSACFPFAEDIDLSDGISLAEANVLALCFNPAVVRARHESNLTGAQLVQAGLLDNPELFVGPRFSTRDHDAIVPISLSWELPLWGRTSAREQVAQAYSRRAEADLQSRELEVLVEVRTAFIRLWALTRELEVLDTLERPTASIANWVARLQRDGEIDSTTAWLAAWEQHHVLALRQAKEGEYRQRQAQLLERLGLLPSPTLELDLAGQPALPDLADASLAALHRHPLVRVAVESYEASEAELRLEIAKQYPSVRVGPELEDDDGDTSLGFGVGMELPLFDRNQAGVVAAEEQRNAAREQYRAALLTAAHAEARARSAATSAAEQLESIRRGPALAAEDALARLGARLDLGVSSVLEVLATQRALTETRLLEIGLESELSIATLSALVAGGSAFRSSNPATQEVKP